MEKRKLTKKEKIVKYILFGLSAVLCVLAIIFTCVKQPIPNSIYKTNTTFEEREAFWNDEYRRLYDNYDASLPLSYFESYIEPRSGIIGQMLYKYSIDASQKLNLELINNSVNKVTVYSLKVVNKQDSTDFYNVTIDEDFVSRRSVTYSIDVAEGFDIQNYIVRCSYRNDGHLWSQHPVDSYDRELDRTKTFTIIDMVKDIIGEKPDRMTEGLEEGEGRPEYMRYIVDARLRFAFLYMGSAILLIFAIFIRFESVKYKSHHSAFAGVSHRDDDVIVKEVIIERVPCEHEHHKVKKVVCLYCGARYKDDLDECPDCGSSRIKEEKEKE